MEKPCKYDQWLKNAEFLTIKVNSPEFHILTTFHSVVKQYLTDPNSHAGKGILDNAMQYVSYYLNSIEQEYEFSDENLKEIYGEE